jgi:hypothetical protein
MSFATELLALLRKLARVITENGARHRRISFTRQEKLADEIQRNTRSVCLSNERKEKFLAKLDLMEHEGAVTGSKITESLTTLLEAVKGKLQRLTALYVDGGLEMDDFKATKNHLVEERISLEQKLKNIHSKPVGSNPCGIGFWRQIRPIPWVFPTTTEKWHDFSNRLARTAFCGEDTCSSNSKNLGIYWPKPVS